MLGEGPVQKPEDIQSPSRLLEVLTHARVVIYFYHNWRITNAQLGCDVCDEFSTCSAEDGEAEFYEASVPALMGKTTVAELEQILALCGPLEQPCVQIFEAGQRIYTFVGPDLASIKNRVRVALEYGRSDEC